MEHHLRNWFLSMYTYVCMYRSKLNLVDQSSLNDNKKNTSHLKRNLTLITSISQLLIITDLLKKKMITKTFLL